MNDYAIKLKEGKQLSFGSIYSLKLVELKILKTYIKNNLANSFIYPSKSLAKAFIFFDLKLDKSLCFFVDYWGFNNITIKNRYSLPLIDELLSWLSCAKRLTSLDLKNVYYLMRIYKSNE